MLSLFVVSGVNNLFMLCASHVAVTGAFSIECAVCMTFCRGFFSCLMLFRLAHVFVAGPGIY